MTELDSSTIKAFTQSPDEYMLCKKSDQIIAVKRAPGMATIKAKFLNENFELGPIVEELRKIGSLSKKFVEAVNNEIERHNAAFNELQKPIAPLPLPSKEKVDEKITRINFKTQKN